MKMLSFLRSKKVEFKKIKDLLKTKKNIYLPRIAVDPTANCPTAGMTAASPVD